MHICLITQYNGNEIYATRYMKSLFLFGRRWIGYFRLYLTGVRYFCMRSKVNQKRLHDLSVMQSRADAQESEVRTFIKEIRRYAAIEKLDEVVLNRLISKILIGEVKKVDGQKVQKVRIVYNFVGEIPEIAA